MPHRLTAFAKGASVSALLLIGLIWLEGLMARQAEEARQEIFHANADRAAVIIADRTQRVVERINDVSIVIQNAREAELSVTESFHVFSYEADIFTEHPEMVAIGHFEVVTDDTRARFIEEFDNDPWRDQIGLPDMDIRPPGTREIYVVLTSVFPGEVVPDGIGFDVFTTPRRETLQHAMDTRQPQITHRIELLSGDQGVVMFTPIYQSFDAPLPIGFVSTAFGTDVFLQQNAALLEPLELDLEIHDMGPASAAPNVPDLSTVVMSTNPEFAEGRLAQEQLLIGDPSATLRDIAVAGRIWRIVSRPTGTLGPAQSGEVIVNAIFGVIIALIVGCVIWRDQLQSNKLELEVDRKTRDLRDAARVVGEERAAALFLASHDELTGLMNRRGFEDALHDLVATCDDPLAVVSVLIIDLDGFKGVNDSLGHQGGDELLRRVAVFLRDTAPDDALICRLGGDEFIVCIPESAGVDADGFGRLVIGWTGEAHVIDGNEVKFGASIGLARGRLLEVEPDRILGDADLALYQAKGSGKGQVCYFDEKLRNKTISRRAVADELQRAFEQDEFVPFFQTQHDSRSHAIVGVEALVRWIKPDQTLVSPADFLPAIEGIGRLHDLDLMIMQKSVDCIRRLEAENLFVEKLSVNVSLPRLRAPGFIDSIQTLPETHARLHLEILETVFLDDSSDMRDWAIDMLRESGIGLEVDDFGSGHASVIGLTQLAPDILKIDRALILPMLESREQQIIIKSIAEIGTALGIRVTAEGVETMEHAQMLRDIGIDTLQGFAFSRPMPEADLRQMLLRQAA